MIVALLVALLAIILVMSLSSSNQVPWVKQLRRLHPGVADKAEWMAPDEIVACVCADYLLAVSRLQEDLVDDRTRLLADAPLFLSGSYLKQYRQRLTRQFFHSTRFVGVLRADHHVQARHFSEDGERCLVIDSQTQRRIATYDRVHDLRLHTQYLDDSTSVYQMVYDRRDKRWKIDTFIQELPHGWLSQSASSRVKILSNLPTVTGRDN